MFPTEAWDIADPDVRAEIEGVSGVVGEVLPIERHVISDEGLSRWADERCRPADLTSLRGIRYHLQAYGAAVVLDEPPLARK